MHAKKEEMMLEASATFASCREVHEHLREWVPRGQGGCGVALQAEPPISPRVAQSLARHSHLREKHRLRLVAGERPPNDAPSGETRTIGAISEERLKPLLRRPILPHKKLAALSKEDE